MSPPNPHPTFANPTVVEALCELHFELPENKPWDPSWYGALFKNAGEDYPKMEPNEIVEVGVGIGPDGFVQGLRRTGLRTVYPHKERKQLFQLSETTFTVNELPPYPTWAVFVQDIYRGWDLLAKTVGPSGLGRIGLRYINRIPRADIASPLSVWIAENEYVPRKMLEARERFFSRTQLPMADNLRLVVTLADLEEDAGARSIQLDIDAIVVTTIEPKWKAIETHVERLHEAVYRVFESCMTRSLRSLLEGQHVAHR